MNDLQSVYDALTQAQDCIRGETPEDVTDAEAREDTIDKVRDAMRTIEAMLNVAATPPSVTDEMVKEAMRAFERMSSVLRYREKDKWHSCDIMGMRDALAAAIAVSRPDLGPLNWKLPPECPRCHGAGRIGVMACNHCAATGQDPAAVSRPLRGAE